MGGRRSALITDLECSDGAFVMAQPDDFKLIKQIVATGGHKHTIGELDRDKYQRLVELGWLKASTTNTSEVSYQVTERGRAAASRF
jgi:hypothetical protein